MTSIEEIVKYQQELLNHQRNQKLLQKETIKLLNALNKNLTFMSDRLDEFALKTNIKLEENNNSNSTTTNGQSTSNLLNKLNSDLFLINSNGSSVNNLADTINLTLINGNSANSPIQQLINTNTSANLAPVIASPVVQASLPSDSSTTATPNSTSSKKQFNKTSIKNTLTNNVASNNNNGVRPYNKNQKVKEYFQLTDSQNNINNVNHNDSNLLDTKLQTYSIKLNSVNNSNNNHINSISNNNNNNNNKNSPIKMSNKTINSLTNASLNNLSGSLMSSASNSNVSIKQLQASNTNVSFAASPITGSSKRIKDTNDQRSRQVARLLDTTNTNGNKMHGSDESIDDMSFDETEDEEEKETIQMKKKPRLSMNSVNGSPDKSVKVKDSEESNNQQRLFNKFVRESVEQKLGKEFLLLHEIQEIDQEVMETIKREALQTYPPINIRPRRAWHLAKASLRCRRRSLRRQQEKIVTNGVNDMVTSIKQDSPAATKTDQNITSFLNQL